MEHAKEHLESDEPVSAAVMGSYETKRFGGDSVRTGVFIATDRRILLYAKKMGGYEMESFPYSNVSSIESSKGLMGGSISFFASGNKAKMKWIKAGDEQAFVAHVRDRIGKKSSAPTGNDVASQIQKLASLRDAGILTEEEFAAKKTEMLARL